MNGKNTFSILLSTCCFIFAQNTVITNIKDNSINCDYLIICPSEFLPSAGKLAVFRNQNAFDDVTNAKAVALSTIYAQFPVSDTLQKSFSIWYALKYAKKQWSSDLSYIVLLGDDQPEVRGFGYSARSPQSIGLMPTFYFSTDTILRRTDSGLYIKDTTFYYSDHFYLTTGDSVPTRSFWKYDINQAIGRIPARSNEECDSYITKLIRYETLTSAEGWRNSIDISADDNFCANYPDPLYPALFNSAEKVSALLSVNGFDVHKTYLSSFKKSLNGLHETAKNDFFKTINNGTKLAIFFGHGSKSQWTDELFLQSTDTIFFANDGKPSIVLGFTCSNGDFLRSTSPQMCIPFLFSKNGGCIAYFAAAQGTGASSNELLASSIINKLVQSDSISLGMAIAWAKYFTYDENSLSYTILGDPAISFRKNNIPLTINSISKSQNSIDINSTVQPIDASPVYFEYRVIREDLTTCLDDSTKSYMKDSLLITYSGIVNGLIQAKIPSLICSNSGKDTKFKFILYVWNATGEGRIDTPFVSNSRTTIYLLTTPSKPNVQINGKFISISLPGFYSNSEILFNLVDLKGRQIMHTTIMTTGNQARINLSDRKIGKGLYLFSLKSGKTVLDGNLFLSKI